MKSNGWAVQLEILLPYGVFTRVADVTRIVMVTVAGSFGLLPQHRDCAAVLSPGLLTYATATAGDVHLAVDGGVLVKTGSEVFACVRHAIAGADLGGLRQAVEREFLNLDEQEKSIRTTLAQLESGLIRRFLELHHG
ncbi:MAG TPA: F0F1 ATP synthase subunit epsilon [Steroidobacteraceae bacterium]